MKLLKAIWWTIRNEPLDFGDGDIWKTDRREHWEIVKPWWIHTFLTRKQGCGCRIRRITRRHTIWCGPHGFPDEFDV